MVDLPARAARITSLPPYLFAELDRLKAQARDKGVDIIDLGVGDPDTPTPPHIIAAAEKAARDPANHKYPSYLGMAPFREAVAQWYKTRFDVALDPATEVLALIGAKEGVAHLPLAYIDPGDVVLCPSPGYPVYTIGTSFCGGEPYIMSLTADTDWLPDLDAIPEDIRRRAKLMWLNYPNNPTGAVATREFFEKVVAFATAHSIIVAHDAAYTEMYFDNEKPISFLNTPGAREIGIEIHSLSKTYNMTGWRLGMAVGNADVIAAFGKVKTNIDSGAFNAVQCAGIEALTGDQSCTASMRAMYQERRDVLVPGLEDIDCTVKPVKATFYVWAEVPPGMTSQGFVTHLLNECGIVSTPGNGFGPEGEDYFRMALTVDSERLREAVERMKQAAVW